MDKPQNLAEYSEWAKRMLGVDLETTASKDLYNFNAQEAYNAIVGHEFVKGIDAQLAKWTTEYMDCTGSDLFMENTRLELRGRANRRATFRTWHLWERLHSLLSAP
jgi:hypothetical protein